MNDAFKKILNIIEDSTNGKGFKAIESNGTKLYGHVKTIGENAWFHEIFAPLNETEIAEIESSIGKNLPNSLKEFFICTNGIRLFSNEIALLGKRATFKRSSDEDLRLPYSIVTPNTLEQPKDIKENQIIIGSYSYDGSKVIIDSNDKLVFVCERENVQNVIFKFQTFWEFLLSEIERLGTFFNSEMLLVNDTISTLPPNRL